MFLTKQGIVLFLTFISIINVYSYNNDYIEDDYYDIGPSLRMYDDALENDNDLLRVDLDRYPPLSQESMKLMQDKLLKPIVEMLEMEKKTAIDSIKSDIKSFSQRHPELGL